MASIKNGHLKPYQVTPHKHLKAWWICKYNHEWQAFIYSRAGGSGCPYCSGQKVGFGNDLKTKFPETAKEWHPTKNGKLFPEDVMPGSGIKRWWQCLKCDESYEMSPNKRTTTDRKKPRGCPVCAGKKVVKEKMIYTLFFLN